MYVCPMHPEETSDKPGRCSICGMALVEKDRADAAQSAPHHAESNEQSYRPLLIIVGLISLVTFAFSLKAWMHNSFSWEQSMSVFMAGFFLVFAGFKLIDLPGFTQGYSTYDLLAKRWFGYGYIYPFLELGLGLLYATGTAPFYANLATVLLLGFSGLGVTQKLLKHERFQCACLGTFLKVPLTKVTLIEDFGMAAMALLMLLFASL